MARVPLRYIPKNLTHKDKKKQRKELKKSRKLYKKKKYYTRKKVKSFKSKVSPHVKKAMKLYNIPNMKINAQLAKKTKCNKKVLKKIVSKGAGAYFSSGSRPNQTALSWGKARLASSITGGKASAVDFKLLEKGCKKNSKALKLARKTRRNYKFGKRKNKSVKIGGDPPESKSQPSQRPTGKLSPKWEETFRQIREMEEKWKENPPPPIEDSKPPVFKEMTPYEKHLKSMMEEIHYNERAMKIQKQLAITRHDTNARDNQYLDEVYNDSKIQIKRRFLIPHTVSRIDPVKFLNTILEKIMDYYFKISIYNDEQAKNPRTQNRGIPGRSMSGPPEIITINRKKNKLATLLYGKYTSYSKKNIIYTIFSQPPYFNSVTKPLYKKYRNAIDKGLNLIKQQWNELRNESKGEDAENNTDKLLVMLRVAKGFRYINGVQIASDPEYERILNLLNNRISENKDLAHQLEIIKEYDSQICMQQMNIRTQPKTKSKYLS